METVNRVGEFGLIRRIRRAVSPKGGGGPTVGIGDDAFAAALPRGTLLTATTDMLVEHVHFSLAWATPYRVGFKAMAVNLSDLAAMGDCRPLYCLVGLALPSGTPVQLVDKLYTGMRDALRPYGAAIVGGDTVSSKKDIVISVTMMGASRSGGLLLRTGGKPGDIILVTGPHGDSGAGLRLLESGAEIRGKDRKYLVERHLLPQPRLREGALLAASGRVTSMTDSSDGLAVSVSLLAEASGTGAVVDVGSLPLSGALSRLADADRSFDPVELALTGGEDYELVFTAPPGALPKLRSLLPDIVPVGRLTRGRKVRYELDGKDCAIAASGFRHFPA